MRPRITAAAFLSTLVLAAALTAQDTGLTLEDDEGVRVYGFVSDLRSGEPVRLRGGCTPIVVLDGLRLGNPIRIDDILTVNEVEALEVYQGSETPIQYTNITTCGVIMLWTRDPIAEEGAGFSWGRTITVVAIGIAMIFGPR